jgi:undecaprenyl-diphosphatase
MADLRGDTQGQFVAVHPAMSGKGKGMERCLNHGNDRGRRRGPRRHLVRHKLVWVLLVALLVVVGTWAFLELTGDVLEGDTRAFDRWLIDVLRHPEDSEWPRGPRWLVEVGRDITALGSSMVLALVTAVVIAYLVLQRKYGAMWFVIVTTASGGLLSHLLKELFGRERPNPVPCVWVSSPSFPSGHAMLAALVYLTLGILLARIEPRPLLKVYFLVVAMALTCLVGVSRVYLGVHYPTDILAGWTVGLVWALLCWLAASYLQRRGAVER